MKIPITQSEEWQKLQTDLGEKSHFERADDYQYLAIEKKTPVGNYLYLPYGPVLRSASSAPQAIDSILRLGEKTRPMFIRIEPQCADVKKYLPMSARKVRDICPADTWVLDLSPDQATLLTNFSQGTRTRYNTAPKKGIIVEKTRDLAEIRHLVSLQGKLFKSKHLTAYDAGYLEKELAQPFATLYLARYSRAHDLSRAPEKAINQPQASPSPIQPNPADGQVLAASLFFDYDETRYYMQSAADQSFRRLPATVALLSQAIFDAKAQGIRCFDFWGIAPDGAPDDHPWKGFTTFKKSFGGNSVHYAGTYDLILSPAKYRLYNLLRRMRS